MPGDEQKMLVIITIHLGQSNQSDSLLIDCNKYAPTLQYASTTKYTAATRQDIFFCSTSFFMICTIWKYKGSGLMNITSPVNPLPSSHHFKSKIYYIPSWSQVEILKQQVKAISWSRRCTILPSPRQKR